MSETAARSDEWHPVKSGTDGSVALAMAHVIVSEEMADLSFIENRAEVSLEDLKKISGNLSKLTQPFIEYDCEITSHARRGLKIREPETRRESRKKPKDRPEIFYVK